MTATWRDDLTPILARWERPPQALDVLAQFRAVYATEALDAIPFPPLATPAAAPIRVLAQCLGRLFLLPFTLSLTLARALWCRYQASVRGRQALEVEEHLQALAFLGAEASRRGHWAAWAEAEERMGSERRYWAFLRRAERGWLARARAVRR